jgi:hypothetical protein
MPRVQLSRQKVCFVFNYFVIQVAFVDYATVELQNWTEQFHQRDHVRPEARHLVGLQHGGGLVWCQGKEYMLIKGKASWTIYVFQLMRQSKT